MKDEIKEILDMLNRMAKENKESDNPLQATVILFEILYKILDYITNLQEEIHKKEAMYDSLAVDYRLSQEENERLKQSILNAIDKMNSEMVIINDRGYYYTDISALEDILQINDKDFIDYKLRNEKAIEYIEERKNLNWYADGVFVYELLNILNGDDEEC